MINLALTTDKLQIITSAASTIDVHASWVDDVSDAMTPGKTNTAIASATTTDVVPAPGSGVRNVKLLSARNRDAALSSDVTVQYNANGTLYQLFKCTLQIGEELIMREGVFFHHDVNGGVYGYSGAGIDVQIFTATGANTWTKPTPFTPRAVNANLWGAGGGGGAGSSVATHLAIKIPGAGGGGGAHADDIFLAADLPSTVTVTIGAGGLAGAKGAAGALGGDGGVGGTTS